MLNVQGKILPVSNKNVCLVAEFVDNTVAMGESQIQEHKKKIRRVFYTDPHAQASTIAIKAIQCADLIVLGIGSLYTSLLPSLLYPKICSALKNSKALVCYFANLFTEPGETDNMNVQDHINAIEQHTFPGLIHTVVVNNKVIPAKLIRKYAQANQHVCTNGTKSSVTVLPWPLAAVTQKKYVHHNVLQVQTALEKIIDNLR